MTAWLIGFLRRMEDRRRRLIVVLAECPWRAAARFVAAVVGVLALIGAVPEIAAAADRLARWAAFDAAAAVERAVLAMAGAGRVMP